MRSFILATLTILVLLSQTLVLGQSNDPKASGAVESGPGSTPDATFAQRTPRYQLRPDDVLDVRFEFTPDLNQKVAVQPDGYVTLREVGDVHVAGSTVPEVRAAICKLYARFLHEPSIEIVLLEFEHPYFTATGMVNRPGKYDLRGDTTVLEGIARAGGFVTDAAKHSQVLLFRRVSSEWYETKVLDVKKMLDQQKNLSEDVHLRPGDMIYVPQNRISKIKRYIPSTGMGVSLTPGAF